MCFARVRFEFGFVVNRKLILQTLYFFVSSERTRYSLLCVKNGPKALRVMEIKSFDYARKTMLQL